MPSKTYSILAAARPVVAAIDPGTEVTRILSDSGAGACVNPDDPEAFTDALRAMVNSPNMGKDAGLKGRQWVESHVSPARVANAYLEVIASLGVQQVASILRG